MPSSSEEVSSAKGEEDPRSRTPHKLRRNPRGATPKQTKQSLSRPGHNAYLKVLLDDDSMNYLHEISHRIQTIMKKNQQAQEKPDTDHSTKKDSLQTRFTFRPRSRDSLHMTFFFGGQVLCALEPHELIQWHGQVRDRLEKDQFFRASSKTITSNKAEATTPQHYSRSDWNFELQEICTFPPHRHDLIVAKFRASRASHDLYRDLRRIAQESSIPSLRDVTACSKDEWVAHVTLGNIRASWVGGSKEEGNGKKTKQKNGGKFKHARKPRSSKHELKEKVGAMLRELFLEDGMEEATDQSTNTSVVNSALDVDDPPRSVPQEWKEIHFRTQGIGMGGPVPSQCDLDWNFLYRPNDKQS